MSRALLLLLLAACVAGSDPDPSVGGDADTDSEPAQTDTDPQTEDTGTYPVAVEELTLGPVAPEALNVLITGALATCADGTATVRVEFLGPVGTAELTPIVDGVLGAPESMAVTAGSLFRTAGATVSADCDTTAWRIVVAAEGQEACLVTGPGAEAWLASSGAACERR